MNRILHISYYFGGVGGAGIAAASRDGLRLSAGPFGWKRVIVRKIIRLLRLPLDVSAGVVKIGLETKIRDIDPKHVYIHWIGNEMLQYEELLCLADIPTTLVLHDFSLFEVPPYRKETWFDHWRLRRIRKVLSRLNLDFEAPSAWAAQHICELQPNAKVTIRPTPVRREFHAKDSGGKRVGDDVFKILFGGRGGRTNPYKGFNDLAKALALLPDAIKSKVELHIFGECAEACSTSGVKTIFHGIIDSPLNLAEIYQSCDALAFPSLSETQGLVKDEALACGLKVITFNRTACPEGICHMQNGYIAEDIADFANGIRWAMEGFD